jgi:hypothetical protein
MLWRIARISDLWIPTEDSFPRRASHLKRIWKDRVRRIRKGTSPVAAVDQPEDLYSRSDSDRHKP